MNNVYAIGHILEIYAYYRNDHDTSAEKILSVSAAISALARSDENYDEEIKHD